MVGFNAISERFDQEGTFALIQPIYELMAAAVGGQGGSVKSFTGDGIMALFGVPDALEGAPLRACRGLVDPRTARRGRGGYGGQARHSPADADRRQFGAGDRYANSRRRRSHDRARRHGRPRLAIADARGAGSGLSERRDAGLVDGLVETSFAGAGAIKGKAEPQRVYRLEAIRRGAARFDAALGRGLSAYVGRDREMEILELAFAAAPENLRVVDMVAKPGMGESRLAHEFQQRIANERAFVLIGNSSPDGQQTPFLPFIEVVRGAFQVRAGEAEDEIARKLVSGPDLLSLHTLENVDLLLNLLGLKPSEGALVGLDGVLIGLRTRDLLQALRAAASRRSCCCSRSCIGSTAFRRKFGYDRRQRSQSQTADPPYAAAGISAALA